MTVVLAAAKTCPTCGQDFSKPTGLSNSQWARRQFCSRLCIPVLPAFVAGLTTAHGANAERLRTRTHCSRGHLLDDANSFRRTPEGARQCKTCRREQNRSTQAWRRMNATLDLTSANAARFWAKADQSAGVAACWPWMGQLGTGGYGQFEVEQYPRRAHRIAYTLTIGPIPDGLQIDHLCRNRRCVNPSHLEPVTGRINNLRGNTFAAVNAAKTHCIHGHPFDEENTRWVNGGRERQCRICRRQAQIRRRAS